MQNVKNLQQYDGSGLSGQHPPGPPGMLNTRTLRKRVGLNSTDQQSATLP